MLLKIILPVLIVAALVGGFFYLKANKPQTFENSQNTTSTSNKTSSASSSSDSASKAPASNASFNIYSNTKYGFSLEYPKDWQIKEFESKDGADFQLNDQTVVRVSVLGKTLNGYTMSFPEYAKIAASQEIQNYNKLNSIEQIYSTSGIEGYITTWEIQGMFIPGSGPPKSGISGPITYFQLKNSEKKTIQVYLENQDFLTPYNKLLSTLKYL